MKNNGTKVIVEMMIVFFVALVLTIISLSCQPPKNGKDGTSCHVEKTTDGGTIYCDDGTQVPFVNGLNGVPGTNGSSCTVVQTSNGAQINCTDGTSATVNDGESCLVDHTKNSNTTIICPDGSSVAISSKE